MAILLTGAAGFIGAHVARALLARGETIVGVDNLNDYYAPALKQARLAWIGESPAFDFIPCDIADAEALERAVGPRTISRVVHLAAQAGVRYSLENPMAYIQSNIAGHAVMLEFCRRRGGVEHMVYASSSSVYGGNTKLPFSETDPVDRPVSLYAATKKADELMSHVYSHLFGLPQTGLRFFTVYGPWGRPDMAYWTFTDAILSGRPIRIFNNGDMRRDFTYIDDVVAGLLACLDHPPPADRAPPHRVFNIGKSEPDALLDFVGLLERLLGRKAERVFAPMQAGDIKETFADLSEIERAVGYRATTSLEEGLPRFVDWYRNYHGV
ncbi:MAG: NAD-dependent epimerase/dehydratase family protein [Amphiplicatus sp.]